MRVSGLYAIYRERWRHQRAEELLAGAGIAIGVALVFGVLVANGSVLGATRQMTSSVNGSASLRLAARSSAGFPQNVVNRVDRLPGVLSAAPLLRESAVIQGPRGRATIQLVGVTARLLSLGGSATRDLGAGAQVLSGGIGLPSGVATAVGAGTERPATLLVNGAERTVQVRAVLDAGAIGALADSGVTVALLTEAQRLVGETGRVSEVLIRVESGQRTQVERGLQRLAAGRLDVLPASSEQHLLEATAKPTSQSSTLFAAIGLMVGFLLALNAMLLTLPERRRVFEEMREQGFDSRQILTIFASQAIVLGLVASLAGVLGGELLARTVFHQAPVYLSVAFPVSGHQETHLATVLLAVALGVTGTVLTALLPVLDLRSKDTDWVSRQPGDPGQAISNRTVWALSLAAAGALVAVTVVVLLAPSLTIVGGVLLALVALCLVPLAYRVITGVLEYAARRYHGGMLAMTVIELNATATRSVALAGVAALAVFGSTAVGGARSDLIHGLDTATVQFFDTADLWVTPPTNDLGTTSFDARNIAATIAGQPGIASVRAYQGGFLDVGAHRLWVRARPANDPSMLQMSQIVAGNFTTGTQRLRTGGGWAAVSDGFAEERGLHVGDSFSLPTPSGRQSFRVAAITSNVGWPPGAITLNASDYRRDWQTSNPAALEITLGPGTGLAAGKQTVVQALRGAGIGDGLRVQTAAQRITQFENNARQGLRPLSEIARLLLLMTALALAGAIGAVIYQRRARLASLKVQGFDRMQLWRSLLMEGATVLVIGCVDGAILGLYGHALADRFLRLNTGFPAPFSASGVQIAFTLLLLAGVSLAVIAWPGYAAAGVSTEAGFRE
ncbi:MAG: FtsX-like permease family protein [Solirubrobacteraceae bacterium]